MPDPHISQPTATVPTALPTLPETTREQRPPPSALRPPSSATPPPSATRRTNFLGCPLDLLTSAQLLEELQEAIGRREGPRVIQFVNANKVAQVRQDPSMGKIIGRAHYVLMDGQPLIPLARMLGIRVPERIDGIGLMGKLLALADRHHYRVYLLGAKEEVVQKCADKIRTDYPGVILAGVRNGYFAQAQVAEVVQQVRLARADILFLGMGSPMKERLADEYAESFGATVIQGVGGSFDVMAGLVRRAPIWMQHLGFEWLYRVLQEPRRMAWRYARTNAICLGAFAGNVIRREANQDRPRARHAVHTDQ